MNNTWQDISTAPRDGTVFLAYSAHFNLPLPTKWVEDSERFRGVCFYGDDDEVRFWIDVVATHWRPLPSPPTK